MAIITIREKELNKRVITDEGGKVSLVIVDVPLSNYGLAIGDEIFVPFDFYEWASDDGQTLPMPKMCHFAHRSNTASADVRAMYDDLGAVVTSAWMSGNTVYGTAYYNTSVNNFSANLYVRNTEMLFRIVFATAPTIHTDRLRLGFTF
jgi:hypothetical protein